MSRPWESPGYFTQNDTTIAKRDNTGKQEYELVPKCSTEALTPPIWLKVLEDIFQFGAEKYSAHNWKKSINTKDHQKFKADRIQSALRHIVAYQDPSTFNNDAESNLPHLGHAAWNLLAVMYYDHMSQPVLRGGSNASK